MLVKSSKYPLIAVVDFYTLVADDKSFSRTEHEVGQIERRRRRRWMGGSKIIMSCHLF